MKNKLPVVGLLLILIMYTFLYKNTGNIIEEKPTQNEHLVTIAEVKPVNIEEEKEETPKEKELTKADKIIAVAKKSLGLPYKVGGTTKKGYDCSGLVMTSFRKEGVSLPRASYQMAETGKEIKTKDVKPGDLIFFKTNKTKPNKISHVGLVTSNENGIISFIHSSSKKGVIISSLEEDYYKKAFSKAKRVL